MKFVNPSSLEGLLKAVSALSVRFFRQMIDDGYLGGTEQITKPDDRLVKGDVDRRRGQMGMAPGMMNKGRSGRFDRVHLTRMGGAARGACTKEVAQSIAD